MSSSLKDLLCIAVRKVDVSSASKTSTTHPQSRQAAESPILVHHRTNHAGRLVLLAGAPGCPTGSTTGLLQWTHCSAAWSMASAGCLQPLSDRQDRLGKATGQRTPKTDSNKTDEFRYNAAPGRGQKQRWRSKDRDPLGRQETPGLSHLSERCFFLCHSNNIHQQRRQTNLRNSRI